MEWWNFPDGEIVKVVKGVKHVNRSKNTTVKMTIEYSDNNKDNHLITKNTNLQ